MLTIWKATLDLTDLQSVPMPRGAEVLFAREQDGQACIWFRCDPEARKEPRTILLCGTGHEAPQAHNARYLGTAMLQGGALVLHIFEQR